MLCKSLIVCRLIEIEPQLKQLDHYLQEGSAIGLKDQCFSFVKAVDRIANMVRCVDCLKEKKKEVRNSQDITKEHCIVSIDILLSPL